MVWQQATQETQRVSVSSTGAQANGDNSGYTSVISADGHFVVFVSDESNLVSADTNRVWDVFVRGLLY